MAGVELLYKNYGILADAGEAAGEHLEAYQSFIDATKASLPEKKLACQFIPKFFIHFPSLADAAIDAQLDLCEEEETPLRCQAIKSLPDFCKDGSDHILRITDILTQLLQQVCANYFEAACQNMNSVPHLTSVMKRWLKIDIVEKVTSKSFWARKGFNLVHSSCSLCYYFELKN